MNHVLESISQHASAPISEAHSLPFAAYRDEEVYALEKTAIFHNEWVFVCSEQELPKPGDYFAVTLADEPVVILRGQDGKLRALSNICRHRGTLLLDDGIGQIDKNITCPYHAWAYDLNGALKAVPFPGATKVEKSDHCLPQFHLESWHGLVFINLAENPEPLAQRLGTIDQYVDAFEIKRFTASNSGAVETWQANWKLAMENGMESYHLFKVHKDTLETVTPTKQSYYVAGSSEWSLTGGKMLNTSSKLMQWLSGSNAELYEHYLLVCLPPSFVGILTYESFDWITVLPIDSKTSSIRSGGIAPDASYYADEGSQQFVKAFFEEDKFICERVQRGMASRHGKGGKLVDMERVVVDFHRYLAARLFQAPPGEFYQAPEAELFLRSEN